MPMQMGIPDAPLAPGSFAARNLPRFTRSSLFVKEILSMRPTHHKALFENDAEMQPGFGGKPPVKDMQHAAAKGLEAARASVRLRPCACDRPAVPAYS
jgi:hypothetical protein